MKFPARVVDYDPSAVSLPPILQEAFRCSASMARDPQLAHLPVPVRFRANGGLRAWQEVLATLEGGAAARAALAAPDVPVLAAAQALKKVVMPHVIVGAGAGRSADAVLRSVLHGSAFMLCFWLRGGALYEPTPALGTLLGGSDIAADLPFQLLVPPAAALCVLPPAQQRCNCADALGIAVFTHGSEARGQAVRELTLLSFHQSSEMRLRTALLRLTVEHEEDLLSGALQHAFGQTQVARAGYADMEEVRAAHASWTHMLDYLVKVLLYLQSERPVQREVLAYSSAPRQLAGLGRRRREERLAQIESLYDRYIVGPESLSDMAEVSAPGERLDQGHELPPHWRRGHFRLQPHGPQWSMRKVLFIPPTVVRVDRLGVA